MSYTLKTNTPFHISVGPLFDKNDGITPITNITVTLCTISIMHMDNSNGNVVISEFSPTIVDMTHISGDTIGMYDLALTAEQLNWLGSGRITVIQTATHLPWWCDITVLPSNIFDSLITGTLPCDMIEAITHDLLLATDYIIPPTVEEIRAEMESGTHFATAEAIVEIQTTLGDISETCDSLATSSEIETLNTIAAAIRTTTDKFRFGRPNFVDARVGSDSALPVESLSALSTDETNGVYLSWERISQNTTNILYQILRAPQFDGVFEPITEVAYPINEYIDPSGQHNYFYKIRELGPDPNNLSDYNQILAESQPIIGEELLVKAALAFQIRDLLTIPIYDEEGLFNESRTTANFAYANWNYSPRPEIRITGAIDDTESFITLSENEVIYSTKKTGENYINGLKYKMNYNGTVFFLDENNNPISLDSYDYVYASYNVRLFTSDEMNNALYMALQDINAQPGTKKFSGVSAVPSYYDPGLITGASYYLLRGLSIRLTQRETRLLIQDAEQGSFNTVEMIQDSMKTYKEDFDNFLKTIGKTHYPTAQSIVTPEFMMPGGRSRFFRYIWKGGS